MPDTTGMRRDAYVRYRDDVFATSFVMLKNDVAFFCGK